MPNRSNRFSRVTDKGRSVQRGWRSYKKFYNRNTFGSKLLRFVMPAFTRAEAIGLVVFIAATAGFFFYLRAHPDTARQLFNSTQHSSSAAQAPVQHTASPMTSATVSAVDTTAPSARSPSPSVSSRPPSGFPTSQAPGVPPPDLAGRAISFLDRYYRQSASDTPASRRALLRQLVPPRQFSKLDHMVADQGNKTIPLVDAANMHSRRLAHGEVYLTAPVAITTIDREGGLSRKLVTSQSTWKPHGKGWSLVFYSDKDSASGR